MIVLICIAISIFLVCLVFVAIIGGVESEPYECTCIEGPDMNCRVCNDKIKWES